MARAREGNDHQVIQRFVRTCRLFSYLSVNVLTTALDGSEDDKIYCFQPTGPIGAKGIEILREYRAKAIACDGHNDNEDPGIFDDKEPADLDEADDDTLLNLEDAQEEVSVGYT